jgi:hypothetical protein
MSFTLSVIVYALLRITTATQTTLRFDTPSELFNSTICLIAVEISANLSVN